MIQKRWYVPLFILMVTVFMPWLKEVNRGENLREEALVQRAPTYSLEQIRHEFEWIVATERKWVDQDSGTPKVSGDPAAYWEFLDRRTMLVDALHKYVAGKPPYDPGVMEVQGRTTALQTLDPTNQIVAAFDVKFGQRAMASVRPSTLYCDYLDRNVNVPTHATEKFFRGYILCIPLVMIIFAMRLRSNDLMVLPELWRLIPFSVVWPLGLCVYPRDMCRKDQVRQLVHFTAQLASGICGMFGLAPCVPVMKAQTLKPSDGQEDGKSRAKKKTSSHSVHLSNGHFGTEIYPGFLTGGLDRGTLVSPWYSFTARSGKVNIAQFGFVEAGLRSNQLFSNNSTTVSVSQLPWFGYRTEYGGTINSRFLSHGPAVSLHNIPHLGKLLSKSGVSSLGIGRYVRVRGPAQVDEYVASWGLRPISVGHTGDIIIEGFYRFRPGNSTNVGQPQLSFRPKKFGGKIMLTFEAWMIGKTITPRFGVQYSH